jgi:uncharacterized lipoprotein YmbA
VSGNSIKEDFRIQANGCARWLVIAGTLVLTGCSSTGQGKSLYDVVQANNEAVTIKTHIGNYSDGGIDLAVHIVGQ